MLSLSDKKRNRLSPLSPCPHIIYYHHKTRRFSICADVIYVIALETVFILPIGAAEDAAVITTAAAGAGAAPLPVTTTVTADAAAIGGGLSSLPCSAYSAKTVSAAAATTTTADAAITTPADAAADRE